MLKGGRAEQICIIAWLRCRADAAEGSSTQTFPAPCFGSLWPHSSEDKSWRPGAAQCGVL